MKARKIREGVKPFSEDLLSKVREREEEMAAGDALEIKDASCLEEEISRRRAEQEESPSIKGSFAA